MTLAMQALALAMFSVAGLLWPRYPQSVSGRDTVVNLATGAGLFMLKLAVPWLIVTESRPGWIGISGMPVLVQVLVGFVALDLARYALHVAHHRVPLLWWFHRVHHSSERLDATSGLRMHVVDFAQLAALPVLLFGWVLDTTGSPQWLVPAVLMPGAISDAFQHANLRFRAGSGPGRAWDLLLNNPHFHAWHHAADATCHGNYGNTLTVWDRMFGTSVSREGLPAAFGLDATQRLRNDPMSLQLLRADEPSAARGGTV